MTTTNKSLSEPSNGTLNWDTPLNANFGIIDSAFGGTVTKNVTGLTTTQTLAAADYQNLVVAFTGTLSANLIYQVPSGVGGQWILSNAATGAFTITFGVASGAGVVIAASSRATVYSDGTNVYAANSASIPGSTTQVIYNSSGSLTGSNSLKFNGTALLTNAIIDAAGGNTATINGITPVFASQAEAEAGSNNTTLMTPLRVQQNVDLTKTTRFGGTVMTSKSRAMSTTYQNTTGGWLVVSVTSSNNGQAFYIGPSSASFYIATTNQSGGAILGLVPPSYYYLCTGSVLSAWYEGQA